MRLVISADAEFERVQTPEQWTERSSSHVGKISFLPAWYSNFVLFEAYPDWRAYNSLSLHLYNDQPRELRVTLRIHDWWHNDEYVDRFNRTLVLRPGDNWVIVELADVRAAPAGREMDMERISALYLFTTKLVDTAIVYIDDIQLR
jgi:hypothetical protein